MGAAYDLDGAFNEALLDIGNESDLPAVLDAVDRLLDDYGAVGAYGLEDQFSDRFISEEISGLRASSAGVPPIFLAVAAFLLNIVITRLLQAERQQIGLIKAFGYTNAEVTGHYFKLILAIAVGGAFLGCLLGLAAGAGLIGVYVQYYKFPFLVFEIDPASFLIAVSASVGAAAFGGLFALRQIFSLTPAVAMRPPTPPDYRGMNRISAFITKILDQPSRMVIRRIIRHPGRSIGAIAGVSAGMALSAGMLSVLAGFDETVDTTFSVIDRSDISVSYIDALSDRSLHALSNLEGVIEVEASRTVAAFLRNGNHTYRGGIYGVPPDARLFRAVDSNGQTLTLRGEGIILTPALADILSIQIGETLQIDVRQGRRPQLDLVVTGIAESLLGSPAYMELAELNQALGETNRVTGAYLRIDPAYRDEIYAALDAMPVVAGVSVKQDAREAF